MICLHCGKEIVGTTPHQWLTTGPLQGKCIIMAGQDEIEMLRPEIDRILEALGFPGALVTDLSEVGHFCLDPDDDDPDDDHASLEDVAEALGIPVAATDTLVDLGWKLRRLSQP